jgi:hypothetical protein
MYALGRARVGSRSEHSHAKTKDEDSGANAITQEYFEAGRVGSHEREKKMALRQLQVAPSMPLIQRDTMV